AAGRYFGVARSTTAIKLAASQVAMLPVPEPGTAWDDAAEAIRTAHDADDPTRRREFLLAGAAASCRAYGCDTTTVRRFMDWWTDRLGD
ncbi:MAG TPA: hypothetical protein DEO57_02890, partial [Phycisphaerales bacterium]|nr:hypothetical protein [Phycisphaerales bacterium]